MLHLHRDITQEASHWTILCIIPAIYKLVNWPLSWLSRIPKNSYPKRNKSLLLQKQVFQSEREKEKKSPYLNSVIYCSIYFFPAFQLAPHKITIFWEILGDESLVLLPQMGTALEVCSLTFEISPWFSCYLQPISSYISDTILHFKGPEGRMGSDIVRAYMLNCFSPVQLLSMEFSRQENWR